MNVTYTIDRQSLKDGAYSNATKEKSSSKRKKILSARISEVLYAMLKESK